MKYAAHISKDVFLSTFQKVHLNAAYFGGTRLDRFSRYQFGLFDDTRIHGVPASGVRFDDVAMVRGSYSFNIFEQYRLDLFVGSGVGPRPERRQPLAPAHRTGRGGQPASPVQHHSACRRGEELLAGALR